MKSFLVSERRACSAPYVSRTSMRYESVRQDYTALKQRLCELALARPRYGYVRLYVLLRREGWLVNKKKVYRVYRELGLMVRTKRRRKRASHLRVAPSPTQHRNERWAMDFVSDSTADGRWFRVFTAIDTHTRECLALEVERSMGAAQVTAALDRAIALRGKPGTRRGPRSRPGGWTTTK